MDNLVYNVDIDTEEKCVKCNFIKIQQDNLQNDKNISKFASKIADFFTKYVNSRCSCCCFFVGLYRQPAHFSKNKVEC